MNQISTPWGISQTVKTIAPGIEEVTTASHGGILLSPTRYDEFNALCPGIQLWAGPCNFEEYQDWCYAVTVFCDLFDDRKVYYAVQSAKQAAERNYNPQMAEWLKTSMIGQMAQIKANGYKAKMLKKRFIIIGECEEPFTLEEFLRDNSDAYDIDDLIVTMLDNLKVGKEWVHRGGAHGDFTFRRVSDFEPARFNFRGDEICRHQFEGGLCLRCLAPETANDTERAIAAVHRAEERQARYGDNRENAIARAWGEFTYRNR